MKRVSDIMTKNVVFVSPETKITEVAETMFKNRFHGLPVLDGDVIVGIITETDFFTKDAANLYLPSYISFLKESQIADDFPEEERQKVNKLLNIKAKDIMTSGCVTILKDMDLNALLEFIKSTQFFTFPVTDEKNSLVGVVTQTDIIGLIKGKDL